MPTDWWRVDLIIAVLAMVLVGSLSAFVMMYMEAGDDFDTLFGGPWICFVPVSIGFTIVALAAFVSFLPHRGSGRRMFEIGLEDMGSRVEMYLESQGITFEKDERVDQVRRTRDHWDTYTFTLDGREASILVRGREEGDSTVVLVSPWPGDIDFVDGLERAILL